MRPIDADLLISDLEEWKENLNNDDSAVDLVNHFIGIIRTAPSAEPIKMSVNVEYDVEYLPDKDGIHQAKATITKAELSKLYKEFYEQGKYDAEVERAFTEPSADRPKGEPETEPAPVVAYICDRRRCAICGGPDGGCDHTTDIKHAAHFKNVAGQYFERPYMEDEDDG